MGVKILDSSIYKQGLKLSLNKKHEIDTVVMDPYENSSPLELIITKEVNTGVLESDGAALTLPLTNTSRKATRLVRGYGQSHMPMWGADYDSSKGVAGVYMATQTVTFNFNEPVQNPEVTLEFEGTTKTIHSGAKTFSDYPDKFSNGATISNWINSNYTDEQGWTSSSPNVSYEGDSIFVHPFINRVIDANGSDPNDANLTDPQYITTEWTGGYGAGGLLGSAWTGTSWKRFIVRYIEGDSTDEGSYPRSYASRSGLMWPSRFYPGGSGSTSYEAQRLRYAQDNASEKIKTEIERISDYQYDVHIRFPVKYIYFAISRYAQAHLGWNNIVDHDSKAFMDLVKKVKVNFFAVRPVGSAGEVSYSLSSTDGVTQNVVNNNIHSVSANPYIKLGTKYGANVWTVGFSTAVLKAYKDGKYTAMVEVPGSYALKNNVGINSEFKLKDLKGNIFEKLGEKTSYETFLTGHTNKLNVGVQYAVGKYIPATIPYPGLLKMNSAVDHIELKIRDARYEGTVLETVYANELEIDETDSSTPIKFYNRNGELVYAINYDYESDNRYITIKLLSTPIQNTGLTWFISNIAGVVNVVSNYYGRKALIFRVKGIQKEYSNRGLIYRLNMIESSGEAAGAPELIYLTSVNRLSVHTEYFFKQPLSTLNSNITRMDFKGNSFTFRRRSNDPASLEILEEINIGRIVFNRSANTLSVYTWVAGTNYDMYQVVDLDAYSNGDEFWTITKLVVSAPNEYPDGNAADLYNNIGGYIR